MPGSTKLTRLIGSPDLDSLLLGDAEYLGFMKAAEQVENYFDDEREFIQMPVDLDATPWMFDTTGAFEAWRGAWVLD